MKKARFTDSQIITILKQVEAGTPVSELCREHGMSNASFYKWRSRFGGMDASMVIPHSNAVFINGNCPKHQEKATKLFFSLSNKQLNKPLVFC